MFFCASAAAVQSEQSIHKLVRVNGLLLSAVLEENHELLNKISPSVPANFASRYYKGSLIGQPQSQLRIAVNANNQWRGMLIFDGLLYRLSSPDMQLEHLEQEVLDAKLVTEEETGAQLCGMGKSEQQHLPITSSAAINSEISSAMISQPVTSADLCDDAIDGICLLPKIEFAYDLSYQALTSQETPIERAVREINEAEMFFETSFGFRFSQLSLTMLNTAQMQQIEEAITAHKGSYDADSPNALLNALTYLRGNYELPYLHSQRSLFQFVTGRDFPGNVVGLAWENTVCSATGYSTGLTDAGGASLVSLVMAHEIGHNLGAKHDEPEMNGCPAGEYVMSASIGPNGKFITEFSSCSIEKINNVVADQITNITNAAILAQCFAFPAEIAISAATTNPEIPPKASKFFIGYQITVEDGKQIAVEQLSISGGVANAAQGHFVSATISNGSCSVNSSAFTCNVNSPDEVLNLQVEVFVNEQAEQFITTANVSSNSNSVVDINANNNMASVEYFSFLAPKEPPNTQTGTDSSASSTSGSGGGGGVSLFYVLALSIAAVARLFKQASAAFV